MTSLADVHCSLNIWASLRAAVEVERRRDTCQRVVGSGRRADMSVGGGEVFDDGEGKKLGFGPGISGEGVYL